MSEVKTLGEDLSNRDHKYEFYFCSKIMQFHRNEVSINTSNWRLEYFLFHIPPPFFSGWYDYVADDGTPLNKKRNKPHSWAAPFDPATGLPPLSTYNSKVRLIFILGDKFRWLIKVGREDLVKVLYQEVIFKRSLACMIRRLAI